MGNPSSFPFKSQSAISRPAIPIQIAPPISKAFPCLAMSLNLASVSTGSLPIKAGAKTESMTVLVTAGCLLKHSPTPTIPSSVFTNTKGNCPSSITVSTEVIFINSYLTRMPTTSSIALLHGDTKSTPIVFCNNLGNMTMPCHIFSYQYITCN